MSYELLMLQLADKSKNETAIEVRSICVCNRVDSFFPFFLFFLAMRQGVQPEFSLSRALVPHSRQKK